MKTVMKIKKKENIFIVIKFITSITSRIHYYSVVKHLKNLVSYKTNMSSTKRLYMETKKKKTKKIK